MRAGICFPLRRLLLGRVAAGRPSSFLKLLPRVLPSDDRRLHFPIGFHLTLKRLLARRLAIRNWLRWVRIPIPAEFRHSRPVRISRCFVGRLGVLVARFLVSWRAPRRIEEPVAFGVLD